MAKQLTFNDLLTKLSNVFKKDMYIYKYQFCLGGTYSEDENEGKILCSLNPVYIELIKSTFKDKEVIYLSDVKKAKKEPEIYIEFISDEFTIHKVNKQFEEISQNTNKNDWKELRFSDDDVNHLFIERELLSLFKNDENIPTLDIAKSTFPLISEKNILDTTIMYVYLGTEENNNISSVLFEYNTEWFKVDEYLMYIELD